MNRATRLFIWGILVLILGLAFVSHSFTVIYSLISNEGKWFNFVLEGLFIITGIYLYVIGLEQVKMSFKEE